MNSPLVKVLKFISIFSVFIISAIIYEIKVNSNNNPKELKLFHSGKTDRICQLRIQSEQECFQKKIGSIFSVATPIMTYHIIKTNNEIMNRSLRISGKSEKNHYQYAKNWNLIMSNLNSFYLRTDKLHFFQILILPIIKISIKNELVSAQKRVQKFKMNNKISKKTDKEIQNLLKYKISITTKAQK